jgi:hypothetical protein
MNAYDLVAEDGKTGMGRFFSRENLDRYRKLASEGINDSERRHLLDVLAMEMIAFRREARGPTVTNARAGCGAV